MNPTCVYFLVIPFFGVIVDQNITARPCRIRAWSGFPVAEETRAPVLDYHRTSRRLVAVRYKPAAVPAGRKCGRHYSRRAARIARRPACHSAFRESAMKWRARCNRHRNRGDNSTWTDPFRQFLSTDIVCRNTHFIGQYRVFPLPFPQ